MTEEQKAALDALRDVKCLMDAEGCGGQWCDARKRVLVAFSGTTQDPAPEKSDVVDA
jgi:hypothetical protein